MDDAILGRYKLPKIDLEAIENEAEEVSSRLDFLYGQGLNFSNELYKLIPDLFRQAIDLFTDRQEREMMLLGSLGVLSGCLPNYYGVYDGKKVGPNLYVFIVAPAGTGKGGLIWARELAVGIHDYLQELPSETEEDWPKTLFIPANISASAFISFLSSNEGKGILFATEADTLSGALAQDWGNFSDILRGSYHHEEVSMARRGSKELFEIKKPYLSIVLTGTPGQVQKLIPSVENGLFSRFSFYLGEPNTEIKDVFAAGDTDLGELVRPLRERVLEVFQSLEKLPEPISFTFSKDQRVDFLTSLGIWKEQYLKDHGANGISSIHRFGLMVFRIAMIFSLLDLDKKIADGLEVVCSDRAFRASLLLLNSLKEHTAHLFDRLPTEEKPDLPPSKQKLFDLLPPEFTRAEAVAQGEYIGMSSSTVDRFLKLREYFERDSQGYYKKVTL